mmetsp:Transcript_12233/g.38342  ORF Transcript_12233/g.38342 Transcript_12233/m.38342 type:complete len:376 (-) Transcript_12233:760-1887(-)
MLKELGEVLPPEEELVSTFGQPEEMHLSQLGEARAAIRFQAGDDRGHEGEEGRDAHARADSDEHLLCQGALRGCHVGPVQRHHRKLLVRVRLCSETALCELLGPIPDCFDKEVHSVVVLPRADRERVPLETRILRHAEEGVHARAEPPQVRRGVDLQVGQRPLFIVTAFRRPPDGCLHDPDGLARKAVEADRPADAVHQVEGNRQGARENHEGQANTNPSVGAMQKEEHRPEKDGHGVHVGKSFEVGVPGRRLGCAVSETEEQEKEEPGDARHGLRQRLCHSPGLALFSDRALWPLQGLHLHIDETVSAVAIGATQDFVQILWRGRHEPWHGAQEVSRCVNDSDDGQGDPGKHVYVLVPIQRCHSPLPKVAAVHP